MADYAKLTDSQWVQLIDQRWNDSETVWSVVKRTWDANFAIYKGEPEWMKQIPVKQSKVRNNRIFRNTESLISALIANLPKPNLIPGGDTAGSKELALTIERILQDKCEAQDLRAKYRQALRGLQMTRLFSLKVYWDTELDDVNFAWVDPRKLRISKRATSVETSEFACEEVDCTVAQLLSRFPAQKDWVMNRYGLVSEEQALVDNKDVQYREFWVGDFLVCKLENTILSKVQNPYWDWVGMLVNEEERQELQELAGEPRRAFLSNIKQSQTERRAQMQPAGEGQPEASQPGQPPYTTYYYNHFNKPRAPYVVGTLFGIENKPVGETDLITQAAPLQESIDERKRQISENAKVVNGITKVDSEVMTLEQAQKLRYDPSGVVWGKGAVKGVQREFGTPLPEFVFKDLLDSRSEIDNLMAASASFRGEREGQETKGGRLALIEQSFIQLNEMLQLINYTSREVFNWMFQLMKVNYTEYHYTKLVGAEKTTETLQLMRDEIDDGIQIKVIPGKSLPQDAHFRFQLAQEDYKSKAIDVVTYLEAAGYEDPKQTAKDALAFNTNPFAFLGFTPEELAALQPPEAPMGPGGEPDQLARVQAITQSPEFQQLPPERQQEIVNKIRSLSDQGAPQPE